MKNGQISVIKLYPGEGFKGFGKLGLEEGGEGPDVFNSFIQSLVGIMTVIAAIWFLILVITGAIGIMTAGGDKQKLQQAAARITNGIIGLFVIIAAIAIVGFFGDLFGFENILNPAELIKEIGI